LTGALGHGATRAIVLHIAIDYDNRIGAGSFMSRGNDVDSGLFGE
jgi:hypothetical protein